MNKTIASMLLLFALLGWAVFTLQKPAIKSAGGVVYDLKPGSSKRIAIKDLTQQGVLKHPYLFTIYAYLIPGPQIKSGEYLFPHDASILSIWRQITSGTGLYYRKFMIIPGWTFAQLRQVLVKTPELKQTLAGLSDQQVMAKLGYPTISPEGEFLPETYHYTKGDTDMSVLKRAFTLMQQRFGELWLKRDLNLPYNTPYKALIVASLIEKEAYLNSERPIIAGVIVNRLNKGMLLQIDPTVIYGMGDKYNGEITKKDLKTDTPYNTYTRRGLPPSPIGMPTIGAIEAVLHPKQHDYYYFVAKGDGSHQFSQTLDEHNTAVSNSTAVKKQKQFFNESKIKAYLLDKPIYL